METDKNLNKKEDFTKKIKNENFEELVKQMEELQKDEDGNLKGGFMNIDDENTDSNGDAIPAPNNCGNYKCTCGKKY